MAEHSEDYQEGYAEGVEVGSTIVAEMCENIFKNRTCKTCGWLDEFEGCNLGNYSYDVPAIIELSGCGKWESKK